MARKHPWWRHVAQGERPGLAWQLRWLRLREHLSRRRSRILLALMLYAGLCLVPLTIGQPHLSLMATLPLLLVPPLGYLVYLMAWHEFHR